MVEIMNKVLSSHDLDWLLFVSLFRSSGFPDLAYSKLGRVSNSNLRAQHERLPVRGMIVRIRRPRLGQMPKAHVTLARLYSTGTSDQHDRLSSA